MYYTAELSGALDSFCGLVSAFTDRWPICLLHHALEGFCDKRGAGWSRWGTSIPPANELFPLLLQHVLSAAGLQAVAGAVCPATDFLIGCWEDKEPGTFMWRPTSASCQHSALPCFKEQKEPIGIMMLGDSVDLRMLDALCTQAKGQFQADIGGPHYYGDLHVCELHNLYVMHVFVPGVRTSCQQAACSSPQEVTEILLPFVAGAPRCLGCSSACNYKAPRLTRRQSCVAAPASPALGCRCTQVGSA